MAAMRRHAATTSASRAGGKSARTCLLLAIAILAGCATYSEKLVDVRQDADRGAHAAALDALNGILGVDSVKELPDSWKRDRPLAVLERAVLLQAQDEYALSARDLSSAETELEMLDLRGDAAGAIGQYVYSDSSRIYSASPTERLTLNALNMANYLALGDLSGAAVEARRYTNMRDYLASIDLEATGTFGSYLAGFTFERLGEGDRALRYYEEALEGGPLDSLAAPVARLARANPYRGPRLEALLTRAETSGASGEMPSEVLVVFCLGRVPYKIPKRIPIGAAVGIAGTFITGNASILERSLFKVVVYPELEGSGTRAREGTVSVDGRPARVELVSNLSKDIRREYDLIKPRIIGSALTRMITRAVAAEGARAAGRTAGGGLGAFLGLFAAWAAEGSMVALDKPDTRSWTFMPAVVAVARIPVEPGEHRLDVRVPGTNESRSIPVDVGKGGFVAVVVSVPR
jgi:tetratricopeptide (TPR) repeat protein